MIRADPRTCVECGSLYAPRSRRQRYCSPRCFHAAAVGRSGAAAADRDPAAVEALVRDNRGLIYFVMSRMGLRGEEYEVTGLYALWRAARRYREDAGRFSTYACVAIRRYLILHRRAERKFRRERGVSHQKGDDPRFVANPRVEMEAADYWNWVMGDDSPLPEQSRIVLRRWAGGATLEEIAAEVGVSRQRISDVRRSAVQALRRRAWGW